MHSTTFQGFLRRNTCYHIPISDARLLVIFASSSPFDFLHIFTTLVPLLTVTRAVATFPQHAFCFFFSIRYALWSKVRWWWTKKRHNHISRRLASVAGGVAKTEIRLAVTDVKPVVRFSSRWPSSPFINLFSLAKKSV